MDFEAKMEQFDKLLAEAKTDEERAEALQKIALAFDAEMKSHGLTEEQREEQLAEFMAMIFDVAEQASGQEEEDEAASKSEFDT